VHTIKLVIEFDGTEYVGWQLQPNGISVQQVVEEALAKILGEPARVNSSGRTDAGVHAKGMVAAFKTKKNLPMTAFSEGLNTLLPPDVAIRDVVEMPPGFNPRADAVGKHYRYTILNSQTRSPLARLYSWRVRDTLDLKAMREAAAHLVGENDFTSFRASGCSARTAVRRVDSIDITPEGDFVIVDVKGTGFLKNMVRIIVGTLVQVGRGALGSDRIPGVLAGKDRRRSGITAPPQGLCLVEVFY
jgi:tRNA pseudouridine38-40 synthase